MLDNHEELRALLFDALVEDNFAVYIDPEHETRVSLMYRQVIDTIIRFLYLHQRDGLIETRKVADAVQRDLRRKRTDDGTEPHLPPPVNALHSDVRAILECLAALELATIEGDLVQLTQAGRLEIARRLGTPRPWDER